MKRRLAEEKKERGRDETALQLIREGKEGGGAVTWNLF